MKYNKTQCIYHTRVKYSTNDAFIAEGRNASKHIVFTSHGWNTVTRGFIPQGWNTAEHNESTTQG